MVIRCHGIETLKTRRKINVSANDKFQRKRVKTRNALINEYINKTKTSKSVLRVVIYDKKKIYPTRKNYAACT